VSTKSTAQLKSKLSGPKSSEIAPVDHSTHLDYFDVAIVGSDILAAGVAREAALRGLKTIIINSEDFANNLSESSGEITLGVERYQNNHDLSLNWEASRERKMLQEICPQLDKKLPYIIPLTKVEQKSHYTKKLSGALYDLMADLKLKLRYSELKESELIKELPGYDRKKYPHHTLFYDSQLPHDRFLITNLLDAADNHSQQYNYWKIEKLEDFLDKIKLFLLDTITGKRQEIVAKLILNLSGPFANSNLQKWGLPVSDNQQVIKRQQFFLPTVSNHYGIIFPNPDSDQMIYAIPWENGTLVSHTSTEVYQNFSSPQVSQKFIQTALAAINDLFPEKKFTTADVIAPMASLKSYLPEHQSSIVINKFGQSNIITVYGGKFSTYLKLAQELVQKSIKIIDKKFGPSISATARLRGSQFNEENFVSFLGHRLISNFTIQQLPIDVAMNILHMYGTAVNQFEFVPYLAKLRATERVCPGSSFIWAQFYYSVDNEFVRKPSDFALRRSSFFLDLLKNHSSIATYFQQAGEYLHLTKIQIDEDLERFLSYFVTTD